MNELIILGIVSVIIGVGSVIYAAGSAIAQKIKGNKKSFWKIFWEV